MTVNIEATTLSMPESLDSLKTTPVAMHRIVFMVSSTDTWYAIMREARKLYGKNWRAQAHVKRKLDRNRYLQTQVPIWFDVPDISFASWCAVKLAVDAKVDANK